MNELAIIAMVAGTYVATNVDNLTIVVSWMLAGNVPGASIAKGYAMATISVLVISTILGLSSYAIPLSLIGYLGIIPIGLGAWSLLMQFRGGGEQVEAVTGSGAALGIGATLTANSVDSIIIFSPLLADSQAVIDVYIASTFAVVAGAWFWLAKWFSRHAAKLDLVTKVAGWLAPFIMIYVGIYILTDTGTDVI